MARTSKRKSGAGGSGDNSISEEEAVAAARRAFTFLTACADGETPGITTGERIYAARAVLEQAARVPRVLNTLMEGVGLLGDEDVMAIAAALE